MLKSWLQSTRSKTHADIPCYSQDKAEVPPEVAAHPVLPVLPAQVHRVLLVPGDHRFSASTLALSFPVLDPPVLQVPPASFDGYYC